MPSDVYFSVCHLSLQTQSSSLDPAHFSIAVFTTSYVIFEILIDDFIVSNELLEIYCIGISTIVLCSVAAAV